MRLPLKLFKFFILLLFFCFSNKTNATAYSPNLADHGVMAADFDGFLDPNFDYSFTYGRISDIEQKNLIVKIQVENDVTRFFKPGDFVQLSVRKLSKEDCQSQVVSAEKGYFTVKLDSLTPCWKEQTYFRRGLVLEIHSTVLHLRVQQASAYRRDLLQKRDAYLKELAGVNNFFWQLANNRDKLGADYDAKIEKLKNDKTAALQKFDQDQVDKVKVQGELMSELNNLDDLLKFYRIDRREILKDRFQSDYDTSAPADQRARAQP